MHNYSEATVQYMTRNFSRENDLTAFPGESPVHLCVKVCLVNPSNGKPQRRFYYNGKWSFEAYRRAIRVFNSLQGEKRSYVIEYTPTVVLYHGHLHSGLFSSRHRRIFYDPALDLPVNYTRANLYQPKRFYPVRVGKHVFMSAVEPPKDSLLLGVLKLNCLNNFRAGLGGFHRDLVQAA